jgi:ATP-dependent Clp protease ATP-binding subunit ClpX
MSKLNQPAHSLICNFCEKTKKEVSKLIVSNGAAICNECIETCSGILTNEKFALRRHKSGILKTLDPKKVKKHLDEYIIGQDGAKEAISIAIINHYKRLFFPTTIEVEKSNIIIHGPTGNGKTMLAKTVAKFLEVPFVVCDATTLTEAGYIGEDATSVLERLMAVAGGDIEHAERGIIFIDEIDKIGRQADAHGSIGRDVGGEGVQQSLLKIIEGGEVKILYGDGHKEELEFNTKDILFICAGAFPDLDKIAIRNTTESSMGFGSHLHAPTDETVIPKVRDFVQYGMIPEFMGRFPITIPVFELTKEEMRLVLTQPKNNLIEQYNFYFGVDDIILDLTSTGIDAIVSITNKEKIGARGLRATLETVLQSYMFNIIEYKNANVSKITLDGDSILIGATAKLEYHEKDENELSNTIEL